MSGKLLMFAKVSLASFIHDVINVFCFTDEKVRDFFKKKNVIKCFVHLFLTDADSVSLQFIFVVTRFAK